MKTVKRAVLCSMCVSVGNAVDGAENGFLRKNRGIEGPSEPIGGTASTDEGAPFHDAMTKMEDLWSQAAAAAQVEVDTERMLWLSRSSPDFSMSMPNRPPTGPDSPPTRQPTPGPPPTTLPPTGDCLQGRTREEYVFDVLVEVTPAEILNDDATPQGMAFDYLANDDPYLENPCVSNTIEQRYGLTTMYYALSGPGWQDSQGWLGDEQECLWFGIDCLGGNPNVVTRVTLCESSLSFNTITGISGVIMSLSHSIHSLYILSQPTTI